MAAGKEVVFYCGKCAHPMESMIAATECRESITDPSANQMPWQYLFAHIEVFQEALIYKRWTGTTIGRPNLSDILAIAASRNAADPRDKVLLNGSSLLLLELSSHILQVFGIYGLARALDLTCPEPDYTRPAEQVYNEAMRYSIDNDRTLQLVEMRAGIVQTPGLPSWVPNLAGQDSPYFYTFEFRADGDLTPTFSFSADGTRLSLAGKVVDVITSCCSHMPKDISEMKPGPGHAEYMGMFKILGEWMHAIRNMESLPTGDPVAEVFCKTLQGGAATIAHQYAGSSVLRTLLMFCAQKLDDAELESFIGNGCSVSRKSADALQEYDESLAYQSPMIQVHLLCGGRRLALMGNGLFGSTTRWARADDVIVLFAGASVLRKTDEGYIFLGPAYIHGLMYGERWDDLAQELDTFCLM